VLLPAFLEEILPRQNLLVNEKQIDTLLAMVPDEGVNTPLTSVLKDLEETILYPSFVKEGKLKVKSIRNFCWAQRGLR
jgi:hypothetical protein